MGLFSRKKPPAPETGLAKAVLMPSVLTMISDGSVDDGEIHQLGNLCGFSPIFAGVDPKALTGLIKEIIGELNSGGLELVTQQVKSQLTMPMRETALLFAIRIALADGRVDDGEKNALLGMAARFEIPGDQFVNMFDVMVALQRPPQTVS